MYTSLYHPNAHLLVCEIVTIQGVEQLLRAHEPETSSAMLVSAPLSSAHRLALFQFGSRLAVTILLLQNFPQPPMAHDETGTVRIGHAPVREVA